MNEMWNVGLPGGPSGSFYSIVSTSGRVIAMQIVEEKVAKYICLLHNSRVQAHVNDEAYTSIDPLDETLSE